MAYPFRSVLFAASRSLSPLALYILVLSWILYGCVFERERTLRYDLIEAGDSLSGRSFEYELRGLNYIGDSPNLLVITSENSVETPGLGVRFPPPLKAILQNVDFGKYYVAVIFRGKEGDSGLPEAIQIMDVKFDGQATIVIDAHFPSFVEGEMLPMESSPYSIVRIERVAMQTDRLTFQLSSDGRLIQERVVDAR